MNETGKINDRTDRTSKRRVANSGLRDGTTFRRTHDQPHARISRIVRLGKSKRLSDVSHVTLFRISARTGQSQESRENNSGSGSR